AGPAGLPRRAGDGLTATVRAAWGTSCDLGELAISAEIPPGRARLLREDSPRVSKGVRRPHERARAGRAFGPAGRRTQSTPGVARPPAGLGTARAIGALQSRRPWRRDRWPGLCRGGGRAWW